MTQRASAGNNLAQRGTLVPMDRQKGSTATPSSISKRWICKGDAWGFFLYHCYDQRISRGAISKSIFQTKKEFCPYSLQYLLTQIVITYIFSSYLTIFFKSRLPSFKMLLCVMDWKIPIRFQCSGKATYLLKYLIHIYTEKYN